MRGGVRIWIGLEGVQHHRVLISRKLSCRKVTGRALHRQWIGPGRHGEDEMKGVAHGRV